MKTYSKNFVSQDRYGFLFWLRWILWFAGSLVLAAIFWTAALRRLFGPIHGSELVITWMVAVFGSWLILVIPFMRKKEQIWKRLNSDQEKAVDVWLLGMGIFLGLMVASSVFWSWKLRSRILAREQGGLDPAWAKAVFASWLAAILPFLVWMYRKAELLFKSAEIRQTYVRKFKTVWVERSKRLLPEPLARKVRSCDATLPGLGHVITAVLKTGERVENVFVRESQEIMGIYDRLELDFKVEDIADIEVSRAENLPAYEESKWTRFDINI